MAGVEKPVFIIIMRAIEDNILSGEYQIDDLIISTTQIAKVFSVNPTTAMRAITELTNQGILYKKRGIGMCVAAGAREKIMTERVHTFFNETMPEFLEEAQKLGIPMAELVKRMEESRDD